MAALLHPTAKAARLRRARGIPGYTEAPTVAAHVQGLLAAGWTRQQIAAAAEVNARTLYGLLHRERPGIQQTTAARILALRPRDAPGLVCAAGTTRRLQALAAAGWPVTWTARRIGVPGPTLRELANGGHARVDPAVANAVAAVFRTHAMRPGPSTYARTVAARNGWAGALAWDDIDNPHDMPQGIRKDAA
jgi:hypothetical protein